MLSYYRLHFQIILELISFPVKKPLQPLKWLPYHLLNLVFHRCPSKMTKPNLLSVHIKHWINVEELYSHGLGITMTLGLYGIYN